MQSLRANSSRHFMKYNQEKSINPEISKKRPVLSRELVCRAQGNKPSVKTDMFLWLKSKNAHFSLKQTWNRL